jgi:anti-sigma B factor antagonist
MELQTTEYENCHVVKIFGRIDSETVPSIKTELDKLVSEKKLHLVLDMVDVSFVSSSGWWILINTQKACKRHTGGEIILAGLATRIQHSLQLVGMDDYFKTTSTVIEAMDMFK